MVIGSGDPYPNDEKLNFLLFGPKLSSISSKFLGVFSYKSIYLELYILQKQTNTTNDKYL